MCGIVGSVQVGRVEPYREEVRRAMVAMARRGPDGEGFREFAVSQRAVNSERGALAATVLLGHRRLAIIDLSEAASQPMSTPSGRFHIVFNGEIYNYLEIRADLEKLGHAFRTRSDTEALLQGWECWGIGLLPRLIGMFSFAVLDTEESVLTLARDPFGIKPLYYVQRRESLVFASAIAPLLDFPGTSRQADPQTLCEFLAGGMGDHSGKTFYRDIAQLPPGHYLSVFCQCPGTAKPLQYWELKQRPVSHMSPKEASDRFRDLFETSIKFHLRSDVPIGVSLSGGLDSSSITAMVRAVQGPQTPIHAFSYVADDPNLSEERWCVIVAQATSARNHWVRIQPNEIIEDFRHLVRVQEQPFGSPTIYAQYRIYRAAHEVGLKVILSGQGSDQYLGYIRHALVRFASLVRTGRWLAAIRLLHASRRLPTNAGLSLRSMTGQVLPVTLLKAIKSKRISMAPGTNADWFRRRGVDLSNTKQTAGYRKLHDLLRQNVLETVPSLLRFEDRNAMAFSVENRVPFLTTKLLEFALSLPEEEIISNKGQSKAVLLRAMRGVVPVEILERRDKIGFAMPLSKLNRQSEPWLRSVLADAAGIPVLRASEVQRQLALTLSGQASDTGSQRLLWRWLSLVTWAREFDVTFD